METNYWKRRRTYSTRFAGPLLSRRTVLRGAGTAAVAIGGAALVGCGDDDDEEPAATSTSTAGGTSTSGSGTASATSEANAFPTAKGEPKDGGTYTTAATTTYQQHDPHTALGPTDFNVRRCVTRGAWAARRP